MLWYTVASLDVMTQTHFTSHDKNEDRIGDYVGPLVDTAGGETACTSSCPGENETHMVKITIQQMARLQDDIDGQSAAKLDKERKSDTESIAPICYPKNRLNSCSRSDCKISEKRRWITKMFRRQVKNT